MSRNMRNFFKKQTSNQPVTGLYEGSDFRAGRYWTGGGNPDRYKGQKRKAVVR